MPDCPYLGKTDTGYRENLNLVGESKIIIFTTWYCKHPFHGVVLELGDAKLEADKNCGLCSLVEKE